MQFTSPNKKTPGITVTLVGDYIEVLGSWLYPGTDEIKSALIAAGWDIEQLKGNGYVVGKKGCDPDAVQALKKELEQAYGLKQDEEFLWIV